MLAIVARIDCAIAQEPPLQLKLEKRLFSAAEAAPAAEVAELLVQTDVNRQGLGETVVVLRDSDGALLIGAEDLERWRLRAPETPARVYRGRRYYPLEALPGMRYRLDETKLTLEIETSAGAFAETVSPLPGSGPRSAPILPQTGGFLNYDLTGTRTAGTSVAAGLFEAGFFSRYGVLTNTMLANDLGRGESWRRLESTYTIDQPDRFTSLRLGDSVTRPGAWGRAVRFGGVQFGTNFNTQPGFVRFPVAAAAGQAALPSTVDVYVNNALVARRNVPPGPFSITNIPVVTGAGDIRVVVRDLLGREQLITTPFYGSTALLRSGLSDYSYEIGVQRNDFALSSNHYGGAVGAATYRRGFTDRLTAEARAEFDDASRVAGAAAAWRVGNLGVLNATGALSHSDQGAGRLLGYGLEHNSRWFSAGLQSTVTSSGFRQSGMAPEELPRRRQTAANLGFQFGALGSLSVTHATQEFRDGPPPIKVTTAGYSVPLRNFAQLNVGAVKTHGAGGGVALFTTLAVPLDAATSASVGYERSDTAGIKDNTRNVVLQRSLPLGEGYGYRIQARNDDLTARFELQTAYGRGSVEAYKPEEGEGVYRVGAAGGVGTVGGEFFLSRSITESFALVRVADYANVQVLQDNQVVGRTDANGYAVLPRLRPYDRNPIAVDQGDLPFDAKIGGLRLEAVPYFRSGVLVDFPISRVRAGTLHIILEDGSDLPSGATARIEGRAEEFPVALRGELYLEGLSDENRVEVKWKNQNCTLEVPYPRTGDPLPALGTYLCRGVRP